MPSQSPGSELSAPAGLLDPVQAAYQENKGQWPDQVLFRTEARNMAFWVTRTGMVVDTHRIARDPSAEFLRNLSKDPMNRRPSQPRVDGHVVRFEFEGATGKAEAVGAGALDTHIDFVGIGRPNAQGVKAFREATVDEIVSGIDLRVYRQDNFPRYDIIVEPGVDPNGIRMRVHGAQNVQVGRDGALVIQTSLGTLQQRELFVYQKGRRGTEAVPARFRVSPSADGFVVDFDLGKFDPTRPLIIDPLVYGTYFGGDFGLDEILTTASDNSGTAYFAGWTTSTDFPITDGPYSVTLSGMQDGFIASLQGDTFLPGYIAYVGGDQMDIAKSIQTDQYSNVWLAVSTNSTAFPAQFDYSLSRVAASPLPTGGDFVLSYRGNEVRVPFNATAAQVAAALNALPVLPVGGFQATGGPLPASAVRIFAPSDPGQFPLAIRSRVRSLVTTPTTGSSAVHTLRYQNEEFGFTPTGGTFQITVIDTDGSPRTTGNIVWNVSEGTLQTALRGLAYIGGTTPPRVTVTSIEPIPPQVPPFPTTFPLARFQIAFNDLANQPQSRPALGINQGGILGPVYQLVRSPNPQTHAFVARFERVGNVLDPITRPVTTIVRNIRPSQIVGDPMAPVPPFVLVEGLQGLAVRPTVGAVGPVEMVLAGNPVGTIAGITQAPPANLDRGFYLFMTYGAGDTPTVVPHRSGYVGGTASVQLTDVAMDQGGSVYLVGDIAVPDPITPTGQLNVSLSPTSGVFQTTSGIFTGGSLLRARDGFIRKIAPDGTTVYSGVLGGSRMDRIDAVAVDNLGQAYVVSKTNSFNFPRTVGAMDPFFSSARKLAVTKINGTGTQLLYSTGLFAQGLFIEASGDPPSSNDPAVRTVNESYATDIAVDSRGNAYVAGTIIRGTGPQTGVLLVTPIAGGLPNQEAALDDVIDTQDQDGALWVLNPTATGLLYASCIGEANSDESALTVSTDRTGAAWIGGATTPASITGPFGIRPAHINDLAFKRVPVGYDAWLIKMRFAQPIINRVQVIPNDIAGGLGARAQLQVFLRQPAPSGGASITLRLSNPTVARFNNENGATNIRITIPAGQISFSTPVDIFSRQVFTPSFTDIRAQLDGDFVQTRLNVRPWLESFTLGTAEIVGGESLTGSVTIVQNAPPLGIPVEVTSSSPLVTFPAAVDGVINIPSGDDALNFEIATGGVDVPTEVNITVTIAGVAISQVLTLNPPLIDSISIDPDRISGGESTTGTIRLQGRAGPNTLVSLSQTGQPVTFPATVQVPEGSDEATFTISAPFVPATTGAVIRGQLNTSVAQDAMTIEHTQISSISLNPNPVTAGGTVTGLVIITRPAALTGLTIPLTNSNPTAGLVQPSSVFIPPGATQAQFQILTNPSTTLQNLIVATNKPGFAVAQQTLVINPLVINYTFEVSPLQLTGGAGAVGTITLGQSAPIALTVTVASDNPVVTVPPTVTIPAGQTVVTFPITSTTVGATTSATVTTTLLGNVRSRTLTIFPAAIISFTLNPPTVPALQSTQATITLDQPAPVGGLVVNLTSDRPTFVNHPATITIPAGSRTGTFTVTTNRATITIGVRFTATVPARGQTFNGFLTILPSP